MPGTWKPLTHQPTFNTSTSLVLSDGRIMFQEEATNHWHALTSDKHRSYVDGTWSTLADMSFWRRYYASGKLKDGLIALIGGEQSGAGGDTNKGEIYDPVTNKWSPMPSPQGWSTVGDASCCVLPSGALIFGSLSSGVTAIFNPVFKLLVRRWQPCRRHDSHIEVEKPHREGKERRKEVKDERRKK